MKIKPMRLLPLLAAISQLLACAYGDVNKGQVLFLSETFNGNGRTCGTCHTPGEGFSISPETIAKLPRDDVFFQANIPGLEDLDALSKFGLVTVFDIDEDGINELRPTPGLGGLDALCSRQGDCVVLGQRGDRETNLCNFSNEAIGNHMTKSLSREEGKDFRLMTEQECKDITAFMTSDRVSKGTVYSTIRHPKWMRSN